MRKENKQAKRHTIGYVLHILYMYSIRALIHTYSLSVFRSSVYGVTHDDELDGNTNTRNNTGSLGSRQQDEDTHADTQTNTLASQNKEINPNKR